jgi:hypothetical protein
MHGRKETGGEDVDLLLLCDIRTPSQEPLELLLVIFNRAGVPQVHELAQRIAPHRRAEAFVDGIHELGPRGSPRFFSRR